MSFYVDNLIVENTLTHSAKVDTLTSTVTASGTLALTVASTMAQVFTGSTAGQICKLPDATTLVVGQRYEILNVATVSVALQDNSAAAMAVIPPNNLVVLKCIGVGTAAGTWAYNLIPQSLAASGALYCTYVSGLNVNYTAGVVYYGGVEYTIAAGTIAITASTSGFIYVDPITHVVTQATTLPNNATSMATFVASGVAITSLTDARSQIDPNLVWGITGDIAAQTSNSVASGGSLEKFARADHKHAMTIPLIKSGQIAAVTFTGTPKTASVTFATAFADTAYSINITGSDARSWTCSSVTAAGFTISANANAALTGPVFWEAIHTGEAL
jgi:hypothetical protein